MLLKKKKKKELQIKCTLNISGPYSYIIYRIQFLAVVADCIVIV